MNRRTSAILIVISLISASIPSSPSSAIAAETYKVSANYSVDLFFRDYVYGPWHLASVDLSGKFNWATLIARTSLAQRRYSSSSPTGVQFEMDAYPKLTFIRKSTYAYLNFGYSPTSLFPLFRAGAEIYTGLPWHLEASLGGRYLYFEPKHVFIFTGSLGYYLKDYWFSIRPFVTPKAEGISVSGNLTVRRYWSEDNYLSFSLGVGSSPEEIDYAQDTVRQGSFKAGAGVQWEIIPTVVIKTGVGFEYEEYRDALWAPHLTFSAGISKSFDTGKRNNGL